MATWWRRPERPELHDLQGNVLQGYASPHAAYLFVRAEDPGAARQWLGELVPAVTDARPWAARPASTLNVALTAAGLAAVGARPSTLAGCSEAFRQGMAARAGLLGDTGPAAPEHWDHGQSDEHVLVTLTAWSRPVLDAEVARLQERVGALGGLTMVAEQRADQLTRHREHFGFYDGFSQPAVAGTGRTVPPAIGTPARFGRWRPLPLGEFVLGYRNADGVAPPAPPGPLGRNSTYVVYRKLAQDVAAFRAFVEAAGRGRPGGAALVAAQLLGRWPDGTPLALSPEAPDPALAADPARINAFRFGDDPAGERCPVGSHIRRANPRDGESLGGVVTERHRIIRRGMPYGPRLPEGRPDDGQERGLVFVCFNAELAGQFEFVQRQWLNGGDLLGLGDDPDVLVGSRPDGGDGPPAKVVLPGDPPMVLPAGPRLVRCRAGAYLLQPGISGLRALAEGRA